MSSKENLCRVFTGSLITVKALKQELENHGISSLIQDDHQSGLSAGFYGGSPTSIDLFIQEADLKKALKIVQTFNENNRNK